MNVRISPSSVSGTIRAIASKSVAHRALICAAFADGTTKIRCDQTNKDIEATARVLKALGAKIEYSKPYFSVSPIKKVNEHAELYCGESGSTLRFMLPVAAALGVHATFFMEGRLSERPLSPLYEELCEKGAILSAQGANPLTCEGRLVGNEFSIRGDVSSQFISGLLFASVLMGGGIKINVIGKTESSAYIDMTLDALSAFGVRVCKRDFGYEIPDGCRLISPKTLEVEGDWSNAAFPLCMGAVSGKISVCGLDPDSRQGDKRIYELLREFGASVEFSEGVCTVQRIGELRGVDIDASQIPDLVPVLAVVAALAEGTTHIFGAARLRLKESDRLCATARLLNDLGANAKETDDGLVIEGVKRLYGNEVDSCNDHRIAMCAAVAALACDSDVLVRGAECVSKSYPDFWDDFESLGAKTTKE